MPKQILLVEDSVTMQKVVQITFAREDCQITSATSADEALAKLKELRPDLVLADAGLSGRSGYDLAGAIKADPATREIPVLLLTGNFSPYDEARGQRAGIDAHIVKPFDTQSMIDKVNGLLKGKGGLSAAPTSAAPTPAPEAKKPTPAPIAAKPAPSAQTPVGGAKPAPVGAALMDAPRSTLMGMPTTPSIGTPNLRPPTPAPAPAAPATRPSAPLITPASLAATNTAEGTRMPEPIRATAGASAAAPGGLQMPRASLIPRAPVPAPVLAALERIAARGAEYEAIAKLSAEAIQQIVWEVVPELAEVIIRSELDRLVKERQSKA